MYNYKKELLDIFENDNSPLLNISSQTSSTTNEQKLIDIFNEINLFFKKNNREPKTNEDINERRLSIILNEIRADFNKKNILKSHDVNNLLGDLREISSLQDIFENDYRNILDTSIEDELFDIKSFDLERAQTDFVARRKPCKDFHDFEHLFKKIHYQIKSKERKIVKFEEMDLKVGNFFVLDGMVLFLQNIEKTNIKNFRGKTGDKRDDPRTRCIFENGMESNMYLRSLQKLLYKNGKRISESEEEALEKFNKNLGSFAITGYIYVLKSLSEKQQIKNIPNLYKIGFSTKKVSERIKNASKESTFLNDDVDLISQTPIAGYKPREIENIIQNFFAKRKMNIEVLDKNKKKVYPDEWFSVPIEAIHQAINLLRNNDLMGHRYDETSNKINKV